MVNLPVRISFTRLIEQGVNTWCGKHVAAKTSLSLPNIPPNVHEQGNEATTHTQFAMLPDAMPNMDVGRRSGAQLRGQ